MQWERTSDERTIDLVTLVKKTTRAYTRVQSFSCVAIADGYSPADTVL